MRTIGFKDLCRRLVRCLLYASISLTFLNCGGEEEAVDPANFPPVVALVNGREIQRAQLLSRSKSIQQLAEAHGKVGTRTFYRSVLDELVVSELLYQAAETQDLAPDAEQIADRISVIRSRFATEGEFEQTLASQELSRSSMADALRRDLAIKNLIETELAPRVEINEDQVKEYFARNPDSFKRPEQLRAHHILLEAGPNISAAESGKVRARILGLRKRIEQGEEFSELARQFSQDDETAPSGGDLKWISRGQTLPVFERALFALPVGSVSEPIETPWGFHLILVTEKRPEKKLTFEEARPSVQRFLRELQLDQLTAELAAALRREAEIELFI